MGKLILLIVLGLIFLLALRLLGRSAGRRGAAPQEQRPVERMVICGHCGVHLPESDSIASGGRHFCSEEHRRLAR